jgi:hypothetical protein
MRLMEVGDARPAPARRRRSVAADHVVALDQGDPVPVSREQDGGR